MKHKYTTMIFLVINQIRNSYMTTHNDAIIGVVTKITHARKGAFVLNKLAESSVG